MINVVDETSHQSYGNVNTLTQAHLIKQQLQSKNPTHRIVIYDDER